MSDTAINEFKFGYNSAPSNIIGQAPVINGIDFNSLAINLSGSIANTGIAGQGSSSGIVDPWRPGAGQQRDERSRTAVRPVFADVR